MFTRSFIENKFCRAIADICVGVLMLSCIGITEVHAQDRNLFAISSDDIRTLEKPLADYDADQVVRYVGHALKGISDPAVTKTIMPESDAVKIARDPDIIAGDFHFSSFMINHNFYQGKDVTRRTIGGTLFFEDMFCRTVSMAFDTEYSLLPAGNIIIHNVDIRPVNAPIMPTCRLFFVPAENISQSILKTPDFTSLLDHVVSHAVSVANPETINRTMKNYYVFAFFMDRLDNDATVKLVVSDSSEESSGMSKHSAAFQDQGWHVAYTRAKFAIDGKRETFFKALYTPGSSASFERRNHPFTRIFTSRVTKPSEYMIRQTQMELAQLGYNVKIVDGKAGKRTHEAIRQFQKDIGINADGKPSADILELLEGYRELTIPTASDKTRGAETLDYPGAVLIKKIQTALSETGYDPGPADGRQGTRTIDAIRQFQQVNALPVDGKPDSALLKKLENAVIKQLLKTRKWPNRDSRPEA